MERTTSIASYGVKRKEMRKGQLREQKMPHTGEKKMFPLAKPRLSTKNEEEMNDRSQNAM